MELIIWAVVIGGTLFMIWYGYNLLARKSGLTSDGAEALVHCRICSREFPLSHTIARERIAGIVDYYCAECIEGLYAEHSARGREGSGVPGVESISRN
jgi:hypothetical protein